ncbi:MAG: hypothetical protein Q8928_18985 [Bacteroidota bacterium]|nr:hypothetical protein [Bacteroidota bacterium]
MSETRDYSYKDVVMLLTCQVIAQHFSENIRSLSHVRTIWTSDYSNDLLSRVENQISGLLGSNSRVELKSATVKLNEVIEPAIRDLSTLKKQLDVDFGANESRHSIVLNSLGFSGHYGGLRNGSQSAVIALLYAFKQGLLDPLRQEILDCLLLI